MTTKVVFAGMRLINQEMYNMAVVMKLTFNTLIHYERNIATSQQNQVCKLVNACLREM